MCPLGAVGPLTAGLFPVDVILGSTSYDRDALVRLLKTCCKSSRPESDPTRLCVWKKGNRRSTDPRAMVPLLPYPLAKLIAATSVLPSSMRARAHIS